MWPLIGGQRTGALELARRTRGSSLYGITHQLIFGVHRPTMNAFVEFGAKYLIFIIAFVAVMFTLVSDRTARNRTIALAVMAFPVALLLAWVAGLLYYHTRPFVVEGVQPLIPHPPDNGFPSHHTMLAMATSAVVFVYSRKVGLLLGIMAILIGISRVVAKVHYPVDILGGVAIAIACTGVAWMTLRRFASFPSKDRP
jgi:membrane-associated phospholipid phosphatase